MSLNPRITDWHGKRVWLIGASSGIGLALAQALHARGAQVIVSARHAAALQAFVSAHPGSLALPLDVTDAAAIRRACAEILAGGAVDLLCYCAGHYQAMRATHIDTHSLLQHQAVNVTGALHLLTPMVQALLMQGHGHLSFISSVAGYRGLPKSLAYGPTKAALINLAETLYLDLAPHGLGVSVINPGFVATPLTAQNDFHMPALIQPEQAAEAILQGWAKGQFDIHFPKRFTRLLKLLRCLPYPLYFAAVRRITGL
ncbi:SDR family NAD(P)-dependent oxidoreductase [Tepidicella baoligensis]|uniref:SDR family NAD(P)-dependent oxidoreductase n=1 Tax=Tepidicella baoligensis TaxID=2707016 RepID=UPI0015DA14F1|nr:SDR family NAD(P)-dependent oxidoreductase [Tepidicella baoligensis]